MPYVTIDVELIKYNEDKHEYLAIYNNKEILVDPYVGVAWDNEDVRLGSFKFEGHWFSLDERVFLVASEIE